MTFPLGELFNRTFDPSKNALRVLAEKGYNTNDIDLSDITYIGQEDQAGNWLILRILTSGDVMSIRAATKNNNPTVATYTEAWDNRASLAYGYLREVL